MIPPLGQVPAPAAIHVMFLAELRARGFEGSLSPTHADRTVLSTDNSIYQVFPQAIATRPEVGIFLICQHTDQDHRAAHREV